jgi:6-pyruvoyltetrahydropterin/6-carboxytetrahydropterin synthase
MVIDFSVLSGIIEEHVFKFVDHTFLNEVFTALSWPGETTAENIARFIWRQLVGPISQQNCYLHRIKLWETANYFVEVDYTIELEHGVEPIDLGEDEEPEDDESPA